MGSPGGLIVIIGLSIAIVAVLVLFVMHSANSKRVPVSIVAVGIVIQLIAQRIGDISFYKKMKAKVQK